MNAEVDIVTIQKVLDFVGTFAFAISGIRLAAGKRFDWFGGYVVGLATAIGGGTIRDVMLGMTPFWMTNSIYLICTAVAQLVVILFHKYLDKLNNTWFLFDTLGLALFTIAGLQKTVHAGFPYWVAIIMGCITGAAGGVIRDVLLNKVPLIFRKEIYAMACVLGGIVYWACVLIEFDLKLTVVVSFMVVVITRLVAVKFHISLPLLKG
jgi:uncharacterized membrane protein YeiH